jgi:hypothetical protein
MSKDTSNDFSKTTILKLAQRAGLRCSKCKTLTAGPHTEDNKAVNLGEAAHIRAARPGEARYDEAMTPAQRRDITNGIWLCGTCHTLIDGDEKKYPVDLLYAWKQQHERETDMQITGGQERKIRERKLKIFEDESPAAYQIALDQPDLWEFFLTVELLRPKLDVILREFNDLKRGLVYRPSKMIEKQQIRRWLQLKLKDLERLNNLTMKVNEEELRRAWGPPGQPGDALEIKQAVDKLILGVSGLLEWEIDIHFTELPEELEPVRQLLQGWTEEFMSEMDRLPKEIAKIIDDPTASGRYEINLVINQPAHLQKSLEELQKLAAHYGL